MKYLLGIDIGSSSVKVSLLDCASGKRVADAFSPALEMPIEAVAPGFAEQHPDTWWQELVSAMQMLHRKVDFKGTEVAAIGISYQMHGLVAVDKQYRPLRPSIIWCDSRATDIGEQAFDALGHGFCLQHYLNSPGNFTASKLRWMKLHEPDLYEQIHAFMLPGDYIAYLLTGAVKTTVSGLSEAILWDYQRQSLATALLDHYGIDSSLVPDIVPQFGEQGRLTAGAAATLGLIAGIPVTYRAGDQPNNALSLHVLQPGEVAATAGTSGVVYGVTDLVRFDPESRVNAFVHVNHSQADPRYGILLCVNGTGILNSWLRREVFAGLDYEAINALAADAPIGADGLSLFPFGNGSERVLGNRNPGASMNGLSFNRHDRRHLARAAQEGIVFALRYGMEVMREMGMSIHTIRAGHANMFLSPVFTATFAGVTGCKVELYDTDGAQGAARGAGIGAGIYDSFADAFQGLQKIRTYLPEDDKVSAYGDAYQKWKAILDDRLKG